MKASKYREIIMKELSGITEKYTHMEFVLKISTFQ